MFNLSTADLSALSTKIWQFFGIGGAKNAPIDSPAALGDFINRHASHIAQTTLYGYLKTRAGTSFPALFENSAMLESINIAKWQIWLACLSDLAVYAAFLLYQRSETDTAAKNPLARHARKIRAQKICHLVGEIVAAELESVGIPSDAGKSFAATAKKVKKRVCNANLQKLANDESAHESIFSESPDALLHWAPIADELKRYDGEIVRNSVRFRWGEVRRVMERDMIFGG